VIVSTRVDSVKVEYGPLVEELSFRLPKRDSQIERLVRVLPWPTNLCTPVTTSSRLDRVTKEKALKGRRMFRFAGGQVTKSGIKVKRHCHNGWEINKFEKESQRAIIRNNLLFGDG